MILETSTEWKPNYRVIAFDPGGTTGWASYTAMKKEGVKPQFWESFWDCGQLGQDKEKHGYFLRKLLNEQELEDTVIVCERFNDRQSEHAVDLVSREYIGVIETWCQEFHVPLIMQMPSYAKGFVKDDNLRKAGVWSPRQKHAMDGYRHLIAFLVHKENRIDLLKWMGK